MDDGFYGQSAREAFDLMATVVEEYIVKVSELSFSYSENLILNKLSFSVRQGQAFIILGPSGIGKTTILNILGGLTTQYDGDLIVPQPDEIRMVFQEPRLFPWLSVRQNLDFALRASNVSKYDWNDRIEPLLKLVGLDEDLDSSVAELSYGMAQRVALIRALCCRPKLLLLDEPFSALDPRRRASLNKELKQLQLFLNTSIVMVTHDIEEAIYLGDSILVLDQDRAVKIQASSENEDVLRQKLKDLLL